MSGPTRASSERSSGVRRDAHREGLAAGGGERAPRRQHDGQRRRPGGRERRRAHPRGSHQYGDLRRGSRRPPGSALPAAASLDRAHPGHRRRVARVDGEAVERLGRERHDAVARQHLAHRRRGGGQIAGRREGQAQHHGRRSSSRACASAAGVAAPPPSMRTISSTRLSPLDRLDAGDRAARRRAACAPRSARRRATGDLGQVRHDEHLVAARRARRAARRARPRPARRCRRRPRRRAAVSASSRTPLAQHRADREVDARQLAPRGDPHHRPRRLAGVGGDPAARRRRCRRPPPRTRSPSSSSSPSGSARARASRSSRRPSACRAHRARVATSRANASPASARARGELRAAPR